MTDKMDEFCRLTARASAPSEASRQGTPGIGDNSMGLPAVTLDELGRRLDQELLAGRREYIARATRLGNILIEAKQLLPDGHGSWLPWLEEHGISNRTAQHWMKIARDPEAEIARRLAKSATVALLEEPEPLSPEDEVPPQTKRIDTKVERKTPEAMTGLANVAPQRKGQDAEEELRRELRAIFEEGLRDGITKEEISAHLPIWWNEWLKEEGLKANAKALHYLATTPGTEEWYTPTHVLEAARQALGGIDLDPASCAKANENVRATTFLTADSTPGSCDVERRWKGRVWLNPPYSTGVIERFVSKLVSEYEHPDGGTTSAILLTQNATETGWYQLAMSRASAICLPLGRLNFIRDGEVQGEGPRRGHTLFYFGPDADRFARAFRSIGRCVYHHPLDDDEFAVVKLSTPAEFEEWIRRDYGEEALRAYRAGR